MEYVWALPSHSRQAAWRLQASQGVCWVQPCLKLWPTMRHSQRHRLALRRESVKQATQQQQRGGPCRATTRADLDRRLLAAGTSAGQPRKRATSYTQLQPTQSSLCYHCTDSAVSHEVTNTATPTLTRAAEKHARAERHQTTSCAATACALQTGETATAVKKGMVERTCMTHKEISSVCLTASGCLSRDDTSRANNSHADEGGPRHYARRAKDQAAAKDQC